MPVKTGRYIWLPFAGFALALGGSALAEDMGVEDVEPSAGASEPLPSNENAMDPLDENFEQQTRGSAFFDWTLEDFIGAPVIDEGGAAIGTVSNVVRDDGDDLYLVTTLTGETSGHVVPFDMFATDGSGSLVVEEGSAGLIGTIAVYEDNMDAYVEVDSDETLFDLLNPSGMEDDDV